MPRLEDDLYALEEPLWTGGPEAYQDHCDDRCLVVFGEMAGLMLRQEIAATAKAGRWRDVTLSPIAFSAPCDDVAVIAYDCAARRDDGEDYRARISSTWVRRPGGWKLAAHQQTPRAPA